MLLLWRRRAAVEWVDPVKVLIDSTADWGRIMFDDLNGTNTNGIRIKTVLRQRMAGWKRVKIRA